MAEYKTIKGFKTQSYAADPVPATAAWASAPAINTGRANQQSAGTSTAAVIAGGEQPGTFSSAICETYNGSAWTEVNNLTDARYNVGSGTMGTLTAALAVGGNAYPVSWPPVESWDGTCWTEGPAMVKNRSMLGCCGTQTAALGMGADTPNTTSGNLSEEWNGTAWAEGNNLINTRYQNPGAGTQTAALIVGDYTVVNVESYNGTCWTEVNNINTGRYSAGATGIQTSAIVFGGANPSTPRTGATEQYNGTSWTEVGDLAVARFQMGSAGDASAGLCIGGAGQPSTPTSGLRTETEEWSDYSPGVGQTMLNEGQIWYNTTGNALKYTNIAAGTWASGGTLNRSNGTNILRGTGTTTAALAMGGYYPSQYGYTEQYDGTSWTVKNPLNTPRYGIGSAGTTTAGLAVAGGIESAPYETGVTEEFDGTSWAESGDLTDTRGTGVGCGTQTAALYSGGNYGTIISPTWQNSDSNEEYNGTSWSEKNDLNTGRNYSCQFSAGSTTAALIAGGAPFATGAQKYTEQWNGTSWTEVADLNTGRTYGGGFGNSTSAVAFGGENPASSAVPETEQWNGTSWTEVSNLTNAKQGVGGAGLTGTLGIAFGGGPPSSTATEHWEAETLTVKTVTVS